MLLCFVDDDDTCTGIHNLNRVGAVPCTVAVLCLVQAGNGTVPCTECSPVLVQAGNGTVPCTECSPVSCTGR
jgi:hypothetical protein